MEITGFVARDMDGMLNVFRKEPVRQAQGKRGKYKFEVEAENFWRMVLNENDKEEITDFFEIDRNLFPELKWEDEPVAVSLVVADGKGDAWVGRDLDEGELHLFRKKPERNKMGIHQIDGTLAFAKEFWDEPAEKPQPNDYYELNRGLFPDLKWEDEPLGVKFIMIGNNGNE